MSRLPRYHVSRPRLVDVLEQEPIGIVEAGGGYGKTTLAAEAARAWGFPQLRLGFDPGDDDPSTIAMRLKRSLTRSGLSDTAAVVDAAAGPEETIEALLDAVALERDPVLIVLDDVHHSRRSSPLVVRLADGLPDHGRLLLLARRLPDDLADLRRSGRGVLLGGTDLAFTPDETESFCRGVLGPAIAGHDAAAIHRATGGWPLAVVLIALSLERRGGSVAAIEPFGATEGALGRLIEEEMAALPAALRRATRQLAHLRAVTPQVAEAATDLPGVLEEITRWGIPFAPRPDGRWELPGPVQEHLAASEPLEGAVARRAAAALVAQGDVGTALETLMAAGDEVGAAKALADLTPERADRVDISEVGPIVNAFSIETLETYPEVLLHLARACEPPARTGERSRALQKALALATDRPALRREIQAELARDLARDNSPDEAELLARSVLEEAPPEEVATRARALTEVGRARAWRRDPASLAEAESLLEEAYRLCLALGRRSWAAQVVLPLAYYVYYARGRHELALARIDDALAGLPGRDRYRAVILTFRADVLIDIGRYDEANANLDEARAIGRRLDDARILGYTHWTAARGASQAGDLDRTRAELTCAEEARGDWFDHQTGTEFLGDAADFVARAGDASLAERYLRRADQRATTRIRELELARAAVTARQGDPVRAEELLAIVEADPSLEPRERWRITLLRAEAARRRGEPEVALDLAQRAYEEAEEIGAPALPFVRERQICERLRRLGAGLAEPGATIRSLGAFEVHRGGPPLDLPAGQPGALLRLVISSGGRLPVDAALETLWPETDPQAGRNRLRVVLTRLRKALGDVVVRDGETLSLAEDVDLDARRFEASVRRALRADSDEAAAAARSALALYSGPFLPDDLYTPEVAEERERLARLHLALLDLLAVDARERGDLDEAIRLRELAIENDRFDERHYLEAARLLLTQGRRGRALDVLRRAANALAELDLDLSEEHRELMRAARS